MVSPSSRIGAPLIPRLARYAAAGALLAFCLLSLPLLGREVSLLPLLDEAGYGDSYIIYDIQRYQRTGIIYPELSQPPYLPAQYSPFVYVFYSLPGRVAAWTNPFVGPRLLTLISFFACAAVVISIVVVLISVLFWGWMWGPIGMFLAVPLTMVAKVILDQSADFRWVSVALGKGVVPGDLRRPPPVALPEDEGVYDPERAGDIVRPVQEATKGGAKA